MSLRVFKEGFLELFFFYLGVGRVWGLGGDSCRGFKVVVVFCGWGFW